MRKKIKWIAKNIVSIHLFVWVMIFSFTTASAENSTPSVLAKIGSRSITFEDLEDAMQSEGEQRFQLKEDKLELLKELVRVDIFAREAREAGFEKDPALQREIAKVVDFFLAKEYAKRNVKDFVEVTDEAVRAYYDAHPKEFTIPEKIKVRQIFLSEDTNAHPKDGKNKKSVAEALLERIKKGDDFAKLSEEYSDDEILKQASGDLGYIARGAISPEYEDAVFNLTVGEVSPVLQGMYGLSIFKNEGKQPPSLTPFEDVEASLMERLRQDKENALFLELEKKLYDKYHVEIMEDKLETPN